MAKSNKNAASNVTTKSVEDRKLAIFTQLAAGEIDTDKAMEAIAKIDAESKSNIYFKVSEKLALSVYGLQRMPVTLYKGQWLRLIDAIPALKAFIEANDSKLSQGRNVDKKEE